MNNSAAQQGFTQIAFVFNNVANFEALAAAFRVDVEVHILDASQDGLAQMLAILDGRTGLDALHVIGHGSEASLNLGSVTLDSANIGSYGDVLGDIGKALAPGGDILLYGCDVGADAAGAQFVGRIAQATGADVAASTDATGGAQLGGDWTLEYRTGAVAADSAFDAAAVRDLSTLLATAGFQNVNPGMTTGAGHFVSGFTLSTTQTVMDDPANGINGGIYFDTLTESESFTVSADGTSVGTFDLTGMTWVKAFTFGEFTLSITGHKLNGSTVTAVIYTAQNASTFSVTDSFSDMTGLTSFDVTITGTATDAGAGSTPADLTLDGFTVANIAPPAPSTPDLTAASDLGFSSTDNITSANSIAFFGTGPAGDSSSTARVFIDTNNNGTYDAGTDVSATATLSSGTWTVSGLSTTGLANGTYKAYAQITNTSGQSSPLSSALSFTVDHTAPTLTISSNKSALTTGQTATVTFTFSEDPGTTFAAGDVSVSGGSIGALSGTGTTRTATFTPSANTDSGTASITVAAGSYTDLAGNSGAAASNTSMSFDTKAPTVTISSDHSTLHAGQTANITFTFSEDPGATFSWDGTSGDVVVSGGTLSAITGTGTTRTAVFTPSANTNSGTASITIAAAAYTDAAGNSGGAGTTPAITFDTKAPTVEITSDASALHAGQTASITFTFSEDPGATFSWDGTSGDVTVSGGTLSAISGTGTTRTAVFTPSANTDNGTASITVGAGSYTDAAGNSGGAGSTPAIAFDTKAPTVTIATDKAAMAPGDTATITFTFSEDPGASFVLSDTTVSGGTLSSLSTSGAVRTATFTAASGSSASIAVNANSYTDGAGNNGSGANVTISLDTTPPDAPTALALKTGYDSGASGSDGVIKSSTPHLVGSAEALATVKLYEGASLIGTGTADASGNWEISTATLAEGAHAIRAVAVDAAGNVSTQSAELDLVVDTTAPTVAITSDVSSLKVGETANITFTFSEDPGTAFTNSAVTVSGGTLGTLSGTGAARTAVFTPAANTDGGTASITVAAGAYADNAGNDGAAGSSPSLGFDTQAPTLSISSDKTALKIGETATITFTYSEDPGATPGTISVAGGTLGALSGTGTTRTATFTPDADTNGGSASVSVAGGSFSDAAGNAGTVSQNASLSFDTLAPNAPSKPVLDTASDKGFSSSDNLTSAATPKLTGTAEAGATIKLYDGATQVGSGTADGSGNWAINTSSLADGSHSITAVATDAGGNTSTASSALALTIDGTAPTLAITSDKATLIAGETATITFTFSENPGTTFSWDGSSGDVTVSGGTLSAISGSGTTRTAVFTPSASVNLGTASITVAQGKYTDAAGNDGAAGSTPSISFDTKAPGVTISSDKAALTIGDTALITFTFSEDPGATFDSTDLAVSGGTLGALSGTGTTRTAVFTPSASTNGGTASITIDSGKYTDAAGNAGQAGTTPAIAFDTLAPSVSISSDKSAVAAGQTALITFTFSEDPGAGFTAGSVTVSGGALANLAGTGTTRTATFTPDANAAGTASITLDAAAYQDNAGNTGDNSASVDIDFDTAVPSMVMTSDASSLSIGGTATITFTFSEDPGTSFSWDGSAGDLTVSGGTLSALSGTGVTRTAVFTPNANTNGGTGTIAVSGAYQDAAGNNGDAPSDLTIALDTLPPAAPSAPVLATGSDSGTSHSDNITSANTPTLSGSAEAGASVKLYDGATLVGSGTADGAGHWSIATNTLAEGAHSITATATDAAGNTGAASVALQVTVDRTAPTLAITSSAAALAAGETAAVTFTFSEDPGTTFTSSSVTVSGGTLGAISGSGSTRTAVFTPNADVNAGTASITVASGKYADAAGNDGAAATTPSIHFDTLVPTTTITSDKSALHTSETAVITFTFSEDPGTSFDAGDVTVSGGTLSAISGTGQVRTAVFTPSANTNGGTASITIGAGTYADAAGNAGNAGATPSLVFDTLAPSAPSVPVLDSASDSGASHSDKLTSVAAPTLTGTAEAGATIKLYDGTTLVGSGTADGTGNWSIVTNALAEGAHAIAATATDAAGNTGAASGTITVTVDRTAPTLAITSDKAALIAGETATITFTFSEDPGTSFASGDITVSGGTLSALSGTGAVRTAVFTPTANVNSGTASVTVAAGSYADAAGNDGAADTTPSVSFDTLVPTVAITTDKPSLIVGGTAVITFTFSEDPGASFDLSDVTVSGGTLGAILGTGAVRTAVFTPSANTNGGTASITISDGKYLDAAGNAGHAGTTPSLVFDTLAPAVLTTLALDTASDSGASHTDNLTNVAAPTLNGSAEAGATVKLYDGATLVGSGTADGSGNWSIVTDPLAEGTHTITATETDGAGNTSSPSSGLAITIDRTAPTLAISSDKATLISGQTATITFTFSEDPGSSFTSGDISVSGGTLSALSGTGSVRTAVFTPAANVNSGTASITVAAGTYADAAGNNGGAGTTSSVHFDTLVPTVAITSDRAALIAGQTATITFTFSEDPGTSFTSGDIGVSGGTLSALSGTGAVRTAVFTPSANTNGGTASITIGQGQYSDAAGNAGQAGTTPSLVFDTKAPTLAITSDKAALIAGETATITFTFSEDPGTSFASGDITVSGGTLSSLSGTGAVRTAVFTPTANVNSGTGSVTVAAGSYADAAGNDGGAGATPSVHFDTLVPTVAITTDKPALIVGGTSVITFTFSEDPGASFDLSDVTVSGGTLGAISGTGAVRTAVFTPSANTNGGTASITIGDGKYLDAAGNAGHAGTTPSLVFDTQAPAVLTTMALDTASDSGASHADNLTNVAAPTLNGSAEAGATVKLYDGATLVGSGTADGSGNWSIVTDPLAEGTHTITATETDVAGNTSSPSSGLAITVDRTAPTLAISSDKAALIAGQTATITFTFSEDPGTSFSSGDISVSGGTLSALSGTGAVRTAVFTPGANIDNGTASITVAAGTYADAAGNNGGAGGTPSVHFDTLVPTVAITTDKAALASGDTAVITFTFSEDPGASFDLSDVTVSGGTLGAISGTGATRTAIFTPAAGINGGTASIAIGEGKYLDAAGNAGHAGATPSLVFDTLAPVAPSAPVLDAASDSGASHTDNLTNVDTPTLKGTAEAGATVKLYDGTTFVGSGTADGTGNWSIVTTQLAEGAHTIVAAATDAAGNTGVASGGLALTIDRTAPPAPTLALANGATNGSVVNDGTVKVSNLAPGSSWQYSTDSGAHWQAGTGDTFVLSGDNAYAAVVRQLDIAGNASAASAELKFTLDTAAPTSTVTLSDTALTSGETATVTIVFSEPVSGFDLSDIHATNATLSGLTARDGGRTWTATLTPQAGTSAGNNVVTVDNKGVFDQAGNAGTGTGTSANYSVVTSSVAATIELSDNNLIAGEKAAVTVHFSEAVRNLTVSDFSVPNGKLSGLSSSDGGTTWTATLTPSANVVDLTNVITLDNSRVTGVSGQHGEGVSSSANYSVSTIRPTASLTVADHILAPGASTAVTIKFSGAVLGFDINDIVLTHGTLSGLATADGGLTWTARLTADTGGKSAEPGAIMISLGGVHDAAGNTGLGEVGSQFVVAPANATVGKVDGATVLTQTVTNGTGVAQSVITISEVTPGRQDDPNTPNHGLADIPLVTGPGASAPILTASLPVGASLQASGPSAPLNTFNALTDLINRVQTTSSAGSASQADMSAHAQEFLAGLGSNATMQTQTIVPLVSTNGEMAQPIAISGAQPGSAPGAPVVGLVIDGSGLPAGTTLQLDNVEFAAVVGDVRLIGGAGSNYVIGDGASQTIYLGPEDDVLNGGGGNDFIGSAGGDDKLFGGDGNDLVAGGIGNDTVSGDAGDDMVTGGRSTVGDWDFHISANGTISAVHGGAVFSANGTETVQGAELDATVADLLFLKADPQKVQAVALLYAALDRVPDLAGLSFWSTSGASLQDVARGMLASAEFGGSALGQTSDSAFVAGMYQHVLGRAPEQAAVDYWTARLAGSDGKPAASRADVLIAVALSDEHKVGATGADGIAIAQASVTRESAWFSGSGDDTLDGGAGNDLLVGGDGIDTAVYAGNRAQYHILIGADNAIHVLDTANGDLDTLSGIELASFKDGTTDISFLNGDPAKLERVGLLFQAVLDRAADLAGLKWWSSLNMNATQLAQAFTTTAEYQSHYAGMGDTAFVQALYANSGLDTAAAGGMQSWQDYLAHHTRAELIASWIGQDDVVHAQFGSAGLWLL